MSKTKDILLGFVAGAAVGAAIGILYAPDKGVETRKRLQKKTGELADSATEKVRETYEEVRDGANGVISKLKSRMSKAEKELDELAEEAVEKLDKK